MRSWNSIKRESVREEAELFDCLKEGGETVDGGGLDLFSIGWG
jgi:hypothetical protein